MPSAARVGPLVAFVSGWIALGLASSQKPETAPAARDENAQSIGMAGCAATGCHGRPDVRHDRRDAETWHESFALWLDRDPHTRAYSVLDGALAKKIMANLGKHDDKVPEKATRDARCLACHSNPSLANEEAMADRRLDRIRAEGVSCESCHGNAERWQIAHTDAIPRENRKTLLRDWQMNDLNDPGVQAKTCAGCHVGAKAERGLPIRDMNHDMIAAGHPRLEFDFPHFQEKLATHWQPKHRGTGENPGSDAMLHAWLHGQIATEEAYCELSLDRIARANTDRSPFPEFADWNCSQCHHRLGSEPVGWREQAAKAQTAGAPESAVRKLGRPMWIGSSAFQAVQPMPKFGDRTEVQKVSLEARRKKLEAYRLGLLKNSIPEARRLVLDFLRTEPPSSHRLSWEEATRAYIGLRSLDACLKSAGSQSSNEPDDLRVALWGSKNEPPRKENAEKGYHRKPESRWNWEALPSMRPDTFEATARKYRDQLAADLQKLPPLPSKP